MDPKDPDPPSKLKLLFDKTNKNRSEADTDHIEDDCCLWRWRTREHLSNWIEDRDFQRCAKGTQPTWTGIAGLGTYKQLHQIPGLGPVWVRSMRALHEADLAVVVGFSMSDFDKMAQMQLAGVARQRRADGGPLPVIVIDPSADEASAVRFRRVFRDVEFVTKCHEHIDWTDIG